jgi:hypothetical protein
MLMNNVGMLAIEDPVTVSILLYTLLVMHLLLSSSFCYLKFDG